MSEFTFSHALDECRKEKDELGKRVDKAYAFIISQWNFYHDKHWQDFGSQANCDDFYCVRYRKILKELAGEP